MADITCNITKNCAVLSSNDKGYTKELNYVSWNGHDAKLDIRQWWPEHEKCGKGITLTEEEGRILMEALVKIYEEIDRKPGN